MAGLETGGAAGRGAGAGDTERGAGAGVIARGAGAGAGETARGVVIPDGVVTLRGTVTPDGAGDTARGTDRGTDDGAGGGVTVRGDGEVPGTDERPEGLVAERGVVVVLPPVPEPR